MRSRHAVIVALAASTMSIGMAVSPAGSQAVKEDPEGRAPTAAERRAAAVEEAGRRASEIAEARGALGAFFDEATGQHVIVASRGGGLNVAGVVRGVGAPARVEEGDVTRAAVEDFHARLGQRSFHADAARYSYAAYYDLVGGKLVVQTDAPPPVVESLRGGYSGKIEVRAGSVTEDYSRQADIAPFWGGAAIKNSAGAICSSGFVVKKSTGVRYMTTAGHCYTLGTNVLTRAGNVSMGTVVQRAFSGRDMELIGGKSYGRSVYVGGTNSSTGKGVTGAANPVVGTTGYCRSGQTTGEKCGQKVISITASFCPASGCKHNVIAYNTGGASAGGDSGAPFYWPLSSTSVSIRGMHIGRNTGTGTMYAERWSTISATLAVSIVT